MPDRTPRYVGNPIVAHSQFVFPVSNPSQTLRFAPQGIIKQIHGLGSLDEMLLCLALLTAWPALWLTQCETSSPAPCLVLSSVHNRHLAIQNLVSTFLAFITITIECLAWLDQYTRTWLKPHTYPCRSLTRFREPVRGCTKHI